MVKDPLQSTGAESVQPASISTTRRSLLLAVGAVVFCALVTLNSGGYRYGTSDQAFYVPVVLDELTPELFPHDGDLIAAQDGLLLFDDWFAPIVRLTGVSLPVAFLGAQVVTLILLYAAIVGIGRVLYRSWWAVSALVVLLTVRHRIPETAVNSVEGYFHPRVLAFAIGLSATALFLSGRTRWALPVVGLALLVHPTIGLWFGILVCAAAVVFHRPAPRVLLPCAAVAAGCALWILAYPLRDRLSLMDATWVEVITVKDYLVVGGWSAAAWLGNLAIAAVTFALYGYRRSLGIVSPREGALIAGCGLLVGLFLLSAPFSYALIALAVQLQINRIFWIPDVLGFIYLAWLLVESPLRFRPPSRLAVVTPRRAVVVIVALLALTRGSYRVFVERAGQPIVQVGLADDDWNDVMRWASAQPIGTHFLADPGHAGRYGTSVRVASGRDVYLELIKDSAIAMYSSDVAHRVARRVNDIGDFERLSAERARFLAGRYAIDFLITERRLDLPIANETGRFIVYALGDGT